MALLDDKIVEVLNAATFNKVTGIPLKTDGVHRSKLTGEGIEFEKHKEYSPGDPVKHINWKLFARSGKLYLKEFGREVQSLFHLFVDSSPSMKYGSKFLYAKKLMASLSYLFLAKEDRVIAYPFSDRVFESPITFSSQKMLLSNQDLIEKIPISKGSDIEFLKEFILTLKKGSKIILISDMFFPNTRIEEVLKVAKGRGITVDLFHLLDKDEINFPFREYSKFICPEDSEFHLTINPYAIRDKYKKSMQAFMSKLSELFNSFGFFYHLFVAGNNFLDELSKMFDRYGI